jgi:hypothetical protein
MQGNSVFLRKDTLMRGLLFTNRFRRWKYDVLTIRRGGLSLLPVFQLPDIENTRQESTTVLRTHKTDGLLRPQDGYFVQTGIFNPVKSVRGKRVQYRKRSALPRKGNVA